MVEVNIKNVTLLGPVLGSGRLLVSFALRETCEDNVFYLLFNAFSRICHVHFSFLLIGCSLKRSVRLVEKENLTVSDVDNQIEASVMVHVFKTERDRDQLFSWADEGWADVGLAFAWVVSRYLYHLNVSIEVQSQKMTGGGLGGSMPDVGIDLGGAGSPIPPVVLGDLPPVCHHVQEHVSCKHHKQGQTKPE
jgi:hypothetical protein